MKKTFSDVKICPRSGLLDTVCSNVFLRENLNFIGCFSTPLAQMPMMFDKDGVH